MKLSLREQFEQLAQRPAASPIVSGLPVMINLSVPSNHRVPHRITIVKILAHQGSMGIRAAHELLHRLLFECNLTETLPGVADLQGLIDDLAKADVTATVVEPAFTK